MIHDAFCITFGSILTIGLFTLIANYILKIVSFEIENLSDRANEIAVCFWIVILCFSITVLSRHYAKFYFVETAIHELNGQKFFIYESNIHEIEPSTSSVKIKVIPEQTQCFYLLYVTKKAFFICQ